MEPEEVIVRNDLELAAVQRTIRKAEQEGNRGLARALTRQVEALRNANKLLARRLDHNSPARLHHWRMELDGDYRRRH